VRLQFSSKMPKAKRVVVAAPAEPSSALSRAHTVMPASSYHNGSLAFVPPPPEAGAGVRASPGAGGRPAARPDLKEFVGQLPKALAVYTSKVRCGGWVGAPWLGHRVPVWHQSLGLRSFGAHSGMCRVGGPSGCCRPLGCPVLGVAFGGPSPHHPIPTGWVGHPITLTLHTLGAHRATCPLVTLPASAHSSLLPRLGAMRATVVLLTVWAFGVSGRGLSRKWPRGFKNLYCRPSKCVCGGWVFGVDPALTMVLCFPRNPGPRRLSSSCTCRSMRSWRPLNVSGVGRLHWRCGGNWSRPQCRHV
jgi:hypothetical protein